MPLHAEHPPRVTGPLHPFDDAVWRVCHDREARRERRDGLMVKRIHREARGAEGAGES